MTIRTAIVVRKIVNKKIVSFRPRQVEKQCEWQSDMSEDKAKKVIRKGLMNTLLIECHRFQLMVGTCSIMIFLE